MQNPCANLIIHNIFPILGKKKNLESPGERRGKERTWEDQREGGGNCFPGKMEVQRHLRRLGGRGGRMKKWGCMEGHTAVDTFRGWKNWEKKERVNTTASRWYHHGTSPCSKKMAAAIPALCWAVQWWTVMDCPRASLHIRWIGQAEHSSWAILPHTAISMITTNCSPTSSPHSYRRDLAPRVHLW